MCQPTRKHLRETIVNFDTTRTPYIVGTNHFHANLYIAFSIVLGQDFTIVYLLDFIEPD